MRRILINIAPLLVLTFFIKCNITISEDERIKQSASNLVNNLDSNSINLFKEFSYGRRGDFDFWQRLSADSTLYTCTYNVNKDTIELSVFRPQNFVNDFSSTFKFDTSLYEEFIFYQVHDTIVRIKQIYNVERTKINDTSISTNQLFPDLNPFLKFGELTALKNKFGFIGTSYMHDIGDIMEFWLTPQYKLTYIPDTSKMNPKFKQNWINEFVKGTQIKQHWSLIKVYD